MSVQRVVSANTGQGFKPKTDPDAGVSELIGSIMLIMVVMTAVALVAVILFSQPMPSKIPNLKYITEVNGSTLYIYHNGGDPLNTGEFNVLLDGVSTSYTISDGSSQWALGKNLVVGISSVPNNVQIVYNATGSGVLLSQASANRVNTQNVSPDQAPYLDCSAVRNWDCADQIPEAIVLDQYTKHTEAKRIALMKYGQTDAVSPNGAAYHLNFTVSKTPASMTFGSSTCAANSLTKVNFVNGDKISVYFTSIPNAFTLYGSAPQIWEMTAGLASETYVIMKFTNGTTVSSHTLSQYAICDTFIDEYSDLESTLVLTTDNTNKITSLTVNKTIYLAGVANTSVIRLNNFQPTSTGLYMISFVSSTGNAFYVVGWADSISVDGNTVPLGL